MTKMTKMEKQWDKWMDSLSMEELYECILMTEEEAYAAFAKSLETTDDFFAVIDEIQEQLA